MIQIAVTNAHRTVHVDITPERLIVSRDKIDGYIPLASVIILKDTPLNEWVSQMEIAIQPTTGISLAIFPVITEWQR
jgi:hypothetical protein